MAKKDVQENDYRSERKKRLAQAKKAKKKTIDSTKLASIIISVICVVAVIAITAYGLYAFGVPQSILPAVKIDGKTYSVAEYSYYYTSVFQSYASQASNSTGLSLFDASKDPEAQNTTDDDGNTITYAQLFKNGVVETIESTNYYLKLAQDAGMTLNDEHKQEIETTLSELATYAKQYGYSTSRYIAILYGKGLNEKKFRSLIEDQYLVAQYLEDLESEIGTSISAEDIDAEYEKDPQNYQAVDLRLFGFEIPEDAAESSETTTSQETTAGASDETTASNETTAAAENTTAAEDTTAAEVSTEEETTAAEEKEPSETELLANEMLERVTDENSFIELAREYCEEDQKELFAYDTATYAKGIRKSIVSNQIGKDLAEWLFNDERAVGDKTVYAADDYVYVIYMIATAYRNDEPLVDARHILVSFEEVAAELEAEAEEGDVEVETAITSDDKEISNEGTSYSIDVVKSAYEQASNILAEYTSGAMTEEAFAALAEEHSADTASIGDNGEGGLYESIERGQMVTPFENWVYDEARETGDYDIVMTDYGWHIMYFVNRHDEAPWRETIRTTLTSAAITAKEEEAKEAIDGTAEEAAFAGWAASSALKLINRLYVETA